MTRFDHIEPPINPDTNPNRPPPIPPSPGPDVVPVHDPQLPEHPDPIKEPPTHQPPVATRVAAAHTGWSRWRNLPM